MHFSKLYKLECLLDLSISGDVFCVIREGVASGDQHIKVCIIIRLLFFRQNGPKKSKLLKCLSEGCSTLEIAKILGRDHRTIKRFVENTRKKRVEKKQNANYCNCQRFEKNQT